MHALFDAFGLDWRLLVINLINFGLLSGVLWYFLYQPLTNMLESRREKIAEGVSKADEADKRLQQLEDTRGEMLAQAGRESDDVLAKARLAAGEKQQELLAQSEAAAQAVLRDAQFQAVEMKREAIEESKKEVAKLIVLGMEHAALEKR